MSIKETRNACRILKSGVVKTPKRSRVVHIFMHLKETGIGNVN